MDIEEIQKLKSHYIDDLYNSVRKEQSTDREYYEDTFAVPEVKLPHIALKTGLGRRMIDAPAEQIITSNPQAFVYTGNKKFTEKMNEVANHWVDMMRRMNPQPYKESVKNKLLCGENYVRVAHNEAWVTKGKVQSGLPILFPILEPTVIYGSPEEDENGIPEKVIVFYKRQYSDLIVRYPDWSNPKKKNPFVKNKRLVEWLEYWDKDIRYFEADGEPVLKGGIQENIYGFPPFVRKYSGFGKRSPDGNLSSLIVSDIRYTRDWIKEFAIEQSDIASRLHITAHPEETFTTTEDINAEDIQQNYRIGAYALNILKNVPADFKKMEGTGVKQPTPEELGHLNYVYNQIIRRNPFIEAGFPMGASGRQDDLAYMNAMKRYDTVVENTENEFATALSMAFRICRVIPTLAEAVGLSDEMLDSEYKCEVKLKARDRIEEDRLATLGDRLWAQGQGCIDLMTNLVKYQGYTENEAKEIIANILVDRLTIYNPDVANIMGMEFAEEAGLEEYLAKLQQRKMTMQGQTQSLMNPQSPTTMKRNKGEAVTPRGMNEIDMSLASKGSRNPPVRY